MKEHQWYCHHRGMIPFTLFTCCGGRRFLYVPFVGLLEAYFGSALVAGVAAVAGLFWLLRRHVAKLLAVGAVLCAVGAAALRHAAGRATSEGNVKGWLNALSMADIGVESDALQMWARDSASRLEWFRRHRPAGVLADGFNLSHFETPLRVPVLSAAEAAAATTLLL